MANRYTVSNSNRYGNNNFDDIYKQRAIQREQEAMRKQAEEKMRLEMEARRKKAESGFLQEVVIDPLNMGQYVSQGLQQGLIDGSLGKAVINAGKGYLAGMTPFFDDSRFEAKDTFKKSGFMQDWDTYDNAGETWQAFKTGNTKERRRAWNSLVKGTAEFGWDVVSDPLTYVSFGLTSLLKGTGTKVAGKGGAKAISEVSEASVKEMMEKLSKEAFEKGITTETNKFVNSKVTDLVSKGLDKDEAFRMAEEAFIPKKADVLKRVQDDVSKLFPDGKEEVLKYTSKLNKLQGVNTGGGIKIGVPFGKEIQLTDGKLLKEIGDATLAPYVNKTIDAFAESKAGQLFGRNLKLRVLAKESPELALRQMKLGEDIINMNMFGHLKREESEELLGELFGKKTPEQLKAIQDILEGTTKLEASEVTKVLSFPEKKQIKKLIKETKEKEAFTLKEIKKNNKGLTTLNKVLEGNVVDNISKLDDDMLKVFKDLIDPNNNFAELGDFRNALGSSRWANLTKPELDARRRVYASDVWHGNNTPEELMQKMYFINNSTDEELTAYIKGAYGDAGVKRWQDGFRPKSVSDTTIKKSGYSGSQLQKDLNAERNKMIALHQTNFQDVAEGLRKQYKQNLAQLPEKGVYQKIIEDGELLQDLVDFSKETRDAMNKGLVRLVTKNDEIYLEKVTKWRLQGGVDIDNEIVTTAMQTKHLLKEMGLSEIEAGKLKHMMQNSYVPHIISEEALNNKTILETLNQSEEAQKIGFGTGESKLGSSRERRMKFTIQEANHIVREILQKEGVEFDGDFFINNIYDAVVARNRESYRVLYGVKYGDEALKQFGTKTTYGAMEKGKDYFLSRAELSTAFKRIPDKLKKGALGTLEKYNGKSVVRVNAKDYKELNDVYRDLVKHNLGDGVALADNLNVYELPEYIGHSIQKTGEVAVLKDANAFLKTYDSFLRLFKTSATTARLGFHTTNLMGNTFRNWLELGTETFKPDIQITKANLLKAVKNDVPIEGVFKTANGEIPLSEIAMQWGFRRGTNRVQDVYGNVLNRQNPMEGAKAFNFLDTKDWFWYRGSQWLGENIEDSSRLDAFLVGLKQGKTFEEAMDLSDKILFDYSDLTHFEKAYMQRAIPFYTYTSRNAKFLFDNIMNNPVRFKSFMNGYLKMCETDNMFVDEYMRYYLTTGQYTDEDGNTIINKTNVRVGVDELLGGTDLVGMISPLAKLPVELAFNKNLFYDKPITSSYDTTGEKVKKVGWHTATTFLPGLKQQESLLKGNVVQWMTGVSNRDVNVTDNEREFKYSTILETEKEKRDLEKLLEQLENPTEELSSKDKRLKSIARKLKKYGFE